MRKTYKREVAATIIGVVLIMALGTLFSETADMLRARAGLVIGLALPAFGFLAAAYGMDWVGKQTQWGGDPRALDPVGSAPPIADETPVGNWRERAG